MASNTPTPYAPPPTQPIQASILERVRQQVQLNGLRELLRKANVTDATATDVVNQTAQTQSQSHAFACQVAQIGTTQNFTWVTIEYLSSGGEGRRDTRTALDILFPPNDPKYLAEFVRAQNYQFPIWLSLNVASGQEPTVEYMNVGIAAAGESGAPPAAAP